MLQRHGLKAKKAKAFAKLCWAPVDFLLNQSCVCIRLLCVSAEGTGCGRAKYCCANEQERAKDSGWYDLAASEIVCVDVSLQPLPCDDMLCF